MIAFVPGFGCANSLGPSELLSAAFGLVTISSEVRIRFLELGDATRSQLTYNDGVFGGSSSRGAQRDLIFSSIGRFDFH